MSLKLHYVEASPAARSVMMVMKVLQVPVEYFELDLSTQDQFAQIFLQLNPAHTAPILDDDGFILWESHAIVKYVVDKFGKTDELYPKEVQERAKVDQMLFYNASALFPMLRDVIPIFNAQAALQTSSIPQDQTGNIDRCFEELEYFLGSSEFLATNHLTIADICAMPILSTINYFKELNGCKYPKLNGWLNRLRCENFYKIDLDGIHKFTKLFPTPDKYRH
uniref:Glutathione S-transferase GSTe10 n=1 Tax=Dendroctonus armandi TaxID=77159 RepID=A0A5P9JS68_9CUCU|nr:glutathione S-transferase GSTe10 [Dendroctonus armandi]